MNQQNFDEDYKISTNLIENGEYKEALDILIKYKDEFDKYLDENPNSVSFSNAFEKDLYMEFFGNKNSNFAERSYNYYLLYNNLSCCYLGLDDDKDAYEVGSKLMKLCPTVYSANYNIAAICIHNGLPHFGLITTAMTNAFKFALNKEDLASIIELYGIDYIGNKNPEIAYICVYRAYQLSPTKSREHAVKYFSQFVKASKLSNFNTMRDYAQKYNFAVDFNSRVKKLAYKCAYSEYSRKNKDGVNYYLEILAKMDSKYKEGLDTFKKSILETYEEPIKTYYNDFIKEVYYVDGSRNFTLEESIGSIKTTYKKMIDEGRSKREAVDLLVKICKYDEFDFEKSSIIPIYYFYDCLNVNQPVEVLNQLQINRKQFLKDFKIEENLKLLKEEYNYDKLQAIGYLIYVRLLKYFSGKIDLFELASYCLFLGYHLPTSFVKKSFRSKKRSDLIFIDDYGIKYQMYINDDFSYDEIVELD